MTQTSTAWRMSFLGLTATEQHERVRKLHRQGWSESQLLTLTGWERGYLMRVLANITTEEETRP